MWGAGPVGQFAIASAKLLGAERVIAIDRFPYRLRDGRRTAPARPTPSTTRRRTSYEVLLELTGGRGPDACIDAVGLEAHGHGLHVRVRPHEADPARSRRDRPIALREAIRACRNGGVVSVIGVYGGFIDKFPIGAAA